ncbi:nitronate monooxygenase [Sulfoacidibacillus ferrooxidans]|uniref:Probable nitronate monooxygenase n=1 Tax=Sulfoacidibacillus ferrooxidans TaxID=2005001 RepID=A0A9X1VE66_9BACL|nr:nitronate monooxygenase [Sulfoacidibacillus ferrooxidans]MCI0184513.1 hypothetical protein [Sulfoacidibacillus ferrooxidans]
MDVNTTTTKKWPEIIQGGMGVAISNWKLARAVSRTGQLGVVSGTGIDTVLLRRLQDGDVGGYMRKALAASPWPSLAQKIIDKYFVPNGKLSSQPYQRLPMWTLESSTWLRTVAMLGAFAEVWLAKFDHDGQVGINLLTKLSLPNLAILYGAMNAHVDVVLMGAGIPREIPGAINLLAKNEPASLKCEVVGMKAGEGPSSHFDPRDYNGVRQELHRPAFFPIISSYSLALLMSKKSTGSVEGFIIEGPTAGGHNAPPRGPKKYDESGQSIYDQRDVVDLHAVAALGYPFWLAGGYDSPAGLQSAQANGATGIQVGTLFAYCEESGMDRKVKKQVIQDIIKHPIHVHTDPFASPTGFPFKVVDVIGSLSDKEVYQNRTRRCDLGYLREAYLDQQNHVQYRCAAEPVHTYLEKGGCIENTVGRKCLCNGLMATAGLSQYQTSTLLEPPIVTSGDGIHKVAELISANHTTYTAKSVVSYLLGEKS